MGLGKSKIGINNGAGSTVFLNHILALNSLGMFNAARNCGFNMFGLNNFASRSPLLNSKQKTLFLFFHYTSSWKQF